MRRMPLSHNLFDKYNQTARNLPGNTRRNERDEIHNYEQNSAFFSAFPHEGIGAELYYDNRLRIL